MVFIIYNIAMLICELVLHGVFIGLNASSIRDTWLTYFLVIEAPCLLYVVLNIILLATLGNEKFQKSFLWFRYIIIDLYGLAITAGWITMTIFYSMSKSRLDYSTTGTSFTLS